MSQEVIDLLENTNKNYFVTGRAGTGKSWTLRKFVAETKKKVVVCAPTGKAAINVDGQTMHSLFRIHSDHLTDEEIINAAKRQSSVVKYADAIIIDEVSMARSLMIDLIDKLMRHARKKRDLPFGGCQMIMFGDLYQLSPIVQEDEANYYYSKYKSPYFFSAECLQEGVIEAVELMTMFRQTESEFIEILNGVRNGKITDFGLEQLNSKVNPNFGQPEGWIAITPYNKKATQINETKLKGLPGKETVYDAAITGEFSASQEPADKRLVLKEGAQVMFIKNAARSQDDVAEGVPQRWVNGTMGIVRQCRTHEVLVEVVDGPNKGKCFDVSPTDWEIIKHEMVGDKIQKVVVGCFKQIPLKLGWAITAHKSQGATLDKVILDLDRGAFSEGQTYVALSRCRTFDGLVLKSPVTRKDIQVDKRVIDYMEFMKSFGFLREIHNKKENQEIEKKIDPLEVFRKANIAKAPFSTLEDSQMRKLLCDPSLHLETLRDAISLSYDRLATGFFRLATELPQKTEIPSVPAVPPGPIQMVGKDEEVVLPDVSPEELAAFEAKFNIKKNPVIKPEGACGWPFDEASVAQMKAEEACPFNDVSIEAAKAKAVLPEKRGPTPEELKAEWAKQSEKDAQKTLFSTKGVTVSDKRKPLR